MCLWGLCWGVGCAADTRRECSFSLQDSSEVYKAVRERHAGMVDRGMLNPGMRQKSHILGSGPDSLT